MNIQKLTKIITSDILSDKEKQEFIFSSLFGVNECDVMLDDDGDFVYITVKSDAVEVVDDKMTFTLPLHL